MDTFFTCAYCFESNSIFADPSGGDTQRYVEDCQVCCQPNQLSLYWDDATSEYIVDSEPES